MSAHAASHGDYAANPLDVVEQIVAANDWICDRRSDSEMATILNAVKVDQQEAIRLCAFAHVT